MNSKADTDKAQRIKFAMWGAMGIVFLVLLAMFGKVLQMNWVLRNEVAELAPMITAAAAENEALQDQLAYVQSDEYIAEWAQVHARMTQGDETLLIPVYLTPTPTPTPVVMSDADQTLQEPFLLRWWRALTGD